MSPRIGELFAGYGGLGMGVQAVFGGEVAWYSEIDRGALKILEHRFPGVPNVGDVTTADWSQVEPVDILTGGSPCQDLSHAGKRAGMTEGTRSNLWVAMREAIAQLRPPMVVWENVRGAYSAAADSEVEPCAGCVGDGPGVHLRALGRVLGDLSDLGYDASWHGIRAADVGAPHGRFRVFVIATDTQGDPGWLTHGDGRSTADANGGQHLTSGARADQWAVSNGDAGSIAAALLPTPSCSDTNGAGVHGDGGLDLRTAVLLMPTPRATDGTKGGPNQRGSSGDLMLPSVVAGLTLLPTPAVNDMGAAYTPDTWDEWTERMKAEHGNGNGHGKSLAIEAQRLLPTPRASDGPDASSHARSWSTTDNNLHTVVKRGEISALPAEARPSEELSDVRGAADAQAVRKRTPGGSDSVPQEELLLAELREHEDRRDEGRPALAGEEAQGVDLLGLWNHGAAARPPRGPKPREQRPGQPDDTLCELSSPPPLARGPRCAYGCGEACQGHSPDAWGDYEAAIRRWEICLGRPAPAPTRLSAKGNPQLAADFVEFLMGLPAGWVTDVPGITRNEALKALGNGVVPAQAAAALRIMLSWSVAA